MNGKEKIEGIIEWIDLVDLLIDGALLMVL